MAAITLSCGGGGYRRKDRNSPINGDSSNGELFRKWMVASKSDMNDWPATRRLIFASDSLQKIKIQLVVALKSEFGSTILATRPDRCHRPILQEGKTRSKKTFLS